MGNFEFAAVQPRVTSPETGELILLSDYLDSLLTEGGRFVVSLSGDGKTTAISHIAAHYGHRDDIAYLDSEFKKTTSSPFKLLLSSFEMQDANVALRLASWQRDEIIEYLLATSSDRCGSVMSRLSQTDYGFAAGSPTVWKPILDAMALPESMGGFQSTLLGRLDEALMLCRHAIDRRKLANWLLKLDINESLSYLRTAGFSQELLRWFSFSDVCELFASEVIAQRIGKNDREVMKGTLSRNIIERVAAQLSTSRKAGVILRRAAKVSSCHSISASLLVRLDPSWKPIGRHRWDCPSAHLANAHWSNCQLKKAMFRKSDLSHSELVNADLQGATLSGASFRKADLSHANLSGVFSTGASYCDAKLVGCKASDGKFAQSQFVAADLTSANLTGADFYEADFTRAVLKGAVMDKCDLRHACFDAATLEGASFQFAVLSDATLNTAVLSEASFSSARMRSVNLEATKLDRLDFSYANLEGSLLTGSRARGASFRRAMLCNARMADVDWEDCDLRRANLQGVVFQMGSTRCGIVNSPYPSHGTRTGFYSEDYEDRYFKRPEEVRKASLVNCDLRGAHIAGVDFYLVDLRGAKFDEQQRRQLVATGAILGDEDIGP